MAIDPRRIEVIDERMARVLRAMRPAERVVRGLAMGAAARDVIRASVTLRNPEWDEDRVSREVARRFAGGVC